MVKPLDQAELVGRLSDVLRKARHNNGGFSSSRFQHEDLIIDWKRFEVTVNGKAVHLSPTEFKLLSTLVERRGWVPTHDQIATRVWGSGPNTLATGTT